MNRIRPTGPIGAPRRAVRPGPRPQNRRLRPHDEVARRPRSVQQPRLAARRRQAASSPSGLRAGRWLRPAATIFARLGLGVVLLAVFVFGVLPTDRYVDQRQDLDRATVELDSLLEENRQLRVRVDRLGSDDEIERVARDEYDMILPSEEFYSVLSPSGR